MIFIFLFKSSISNNRANGAQYIITRISWDVAKGIPIIVAGASNVYKYMGVSNANSYIVPWWYLYITLIQASSINAAYMAMIAIYRGVLVLVLDYLINLPI